MPQGLKTIRNWALAALLGVGLALSAALPVAQAEQYNYRATYTGNSGRSYHPTYSHVTTYGNTGNSLRYSSYTSRPSRSSGSSSSSGGTRTVSYNYRNGGRSGYSFLSNLGGGNSNYNGYSGSGSGSINRPHRGDWHAKLQAQRKWDEDQYAKSQQAGGAACGLPNAPAYCYKLSGPYPTEMRIVRY